MADGTITFDTSLDNKQLERELSKLKKDIAKIEESTAGQELKKSPLVRQARELEQKMKTARAEVERYRSAWPRRKRRRRCSRLRNYLLVGGALWRILKRLISMAY